MAAPPIYRETSFNRGGAAPPRPSKSSRDDGADEASASVLATGTDGNGGLTPVNPADFEAFRRRAQAERGGRFPVPVPVPVPRSLAATGVGGPG